MISGIYQIRNLVNNKIYIGSSKNLSTRFYRHRHFLKRNKHHARHLQSSWNKYGKDNFVFEVLEYCNPIKEVLLKIEQQYLDKLNPSYNHCKVAGSSQGRSLSKEAKLRCSIAAKSMDHNSKHKAVIQICKETGIELTEFNSIKKAGQETNTNYRSISMVVNGHRPYAGGFIWKFKN